MGTSFSFVDVNADLTVANIRKTQFATVTSALTANEKLVIP